MNKPRALILCTGNSARSQMAEGIMRKIVGERYEVISAGLEPKGVNPLAIEAMKEVGIDISHHTSKDVRDFLGQHFTYLITVCSSAEQNCPIFPGVIYRLHWPFQDPHTLEEFHTVRDQIQAKFGEKFAEQPT